LSLCPVYYHTCHKLFPLLYYAKGKKMNILRPYLKDYSLVVGLEENNKVLFIQ